MAGRPLESAGLMLFRRSAGGNLEVLLVHPGGPFWARKDEGAWTIPKGLIEQNEDKLAAARREFSEETGHTPQGTALSLGWLRQAGGKVVHAWAIEGDWDVAALNSNAFSMEWPRGSGRLKSFPEVDRAQWFGLDEARVKILKGQAGFLDRLAASVAANSSGR
jgi:predicted NUDIX family NTP pyrophosphohydrolase